MPTIVKAIVVENGKDKTVTIDEALEQKGRDYFCPKCHKSVIPHRKATNGAAARFEHRPGFGACVQINSTMECIFCWIKGIPYGQKKTRGDKKALSRWSDTVVERTKNLKRVKDACILKITFLLPPDKYPADLPYGPDLDNLVKRLCDALNKTIFKDAEGKDSCVIELNVIKTRVESEDKSGAFIEILPIMVRSSGH